jgi:hypothetical protein
MDSGDFEYLFLIFVAGFHWGQVHICRPRVLQGTLIVMGMGRLRSRIDGFPAVGTAVQMDQEIKSIILLQLVLEKAYQDLTLTLTIIHFLTPTY